MLREASLAKKKLKMEKKWNPRRESYFGISFGRTFETVEERKRCDREREKRKRAKEREESERRERKEVRGEKEERRKG